MWMRPENASERQQAQRPHVIWSPSHYLSKPGDPIMTEMSGCWGGKAHEVPFWEDKSALELDPSDVPTTLWICLNHRLG